MSFEEFRQFTETWGGDIDRWPLKARADARRLAATNEGLSILNREQSLDPHLSTVADANLIVVEVMRQGEDGLSIHAGRSCRGGLNVLAALGEELREQMNEKRRTQA